jgi:hypothetical protein
LALWREALLAQAVLAGRTRGYTQHPQLNRFKEAQDPLAAVGAYLAEVHREACRRGYCFDATKIMTRGDSNKIDVTRGQLAFEWEHLLRKLVFRDPVRYGMFKKVSSPDAHPIFCLTEGDIETWERGE